MISPAGPSIVPFHLPGSVGPLFGVRWTAAAGCSGHTLLVLPAFAEEMNKCRRMVSLLAQAAQGCGIETVAVDLTGTGDSAGEFRDATVERWRRDLHAVMDRLAEDEGRTVHVLAVRGGALLLNVLDVPANVSPGRVALWQPITNGKQLVTQFLRLSQAEAVVAGHGGDSRNPRTVLAQERLVEVAGYELSTELVSGIESLTLHPMVRKDWRSVLWIEIAGDDPDGSGRPSPSLAASRAVDAMNEHGCGVILDVIAGEPFWATPEIAVVPGLVERTLSFLVDAA